MKLFVRRTAIASIIFASVSLAPLQAQAYNLDEIIQAGLAFDPAIKAARARLEGSMADRTIARSRYLPQLTYSRSEGKADYTRRSTNSLIPQALKDRVDTKNEVLQLSQAIYDAEALAVIDQTDANIKIAQERYRSELQDFYAKLLTSYVQVLYSYNDVTFLDSSIKFLEDALGRVNGELAGGEASELDRLSTEAQLDLARAEKLRALQRLEVSTRTLESYTGLKIAQLTDVQKPLVDRAEVTDTFEAIEKVALESNPNVRAARADLQAAQAEIDRQSSGHKPRLSLNAYKSISANDSTTTVNTENDTVAYALQLQVPLFSGLSVSGRVEKARQGLTLSEAELRRTIQETLVDLQRNYIDATNATKQIFAYRKALESARKAQEAASLGLEAGLRIYSDVLDTTRDVLRAERDLSEARFAALQSQTNLNLIAGRLDQVFLKRIVPVFSGESVSIGAYRQALPKGQYEDFSDLKPMELPEMKDESFTWPSRVRRPVGK